MKTKNEVISVKCSHFRQAQTDINVGIIRGPDGKRTQGETKKPQWGKKKAVEDKSACSIDPHLEPDCAK